MTLRFQPDLYFIIGFPRGIAAGYNASCCGGSFQLRRSGASAGAAIFQEQSLLLLFFFQKCVHLELILEGRCLDDAPCLAVLQFRVFPRG